MKPDDIVMAFFPCTRFECQISIAFRGEAKQQKNYTDQQKLEYDLKLHRELCENYETITKMAILAMKKGLRMVIENPANLPHYLTSYWSLKPRIKDNDRRMNGDRQRKPTQYWFINFEPKQNLVFEPLDYVDVRVCARTKGENGKTVKTLRSEIHPQYANRFIRQYLIEPEKLDAFGKLK